MGEPNSVLKYMPLVKQVALHVHKQTKFIHNLEDIEQNGVLGLLDGLNKYKEQDNAKIETYINLRIKGSILDGLRKSDVLSQDDRELMNKINSSERKQMALKGHSQPSQLCDELNISLDELFDIKSRAQTYSGEDDIQDLSDNKTPESAYESKQGLEHLLRHVKKLNKKEQLVLHCIYTEDLSLKDIAEILAVSSPRVSQIHKDSLHKLRGMLDDE